MFRHFDLQLGKGLLPPFTLVSFHFPDRSRIESKNRLAAAPAALAVRIQVFMGRKDHD